MSDDRTDILLIGDMGKLKTDIADAYEAVPQLAIKENEGIQAVITGIDKFNNLTEVETYLEGAYAELVGQGYYQENSPFSRIFKTLIASTDTTKAYWKSRGGGEIKEFKKRLNKAYPAVKPTLKPRASAES